MRPCARMCLLRKATCVFVEPSLPHAGSYIRACFNGKRYTCTICTDEYCPGWLFWAVAPFRDGSCVSNSISRLSIAIRSFHRRLPFPPTTFRNYDVICNFQWKKHLLSVAYLWWIPRGGLRWYLCYYPMVQTRYFYHVPKLRCTWSRKNVTDCSVLVLSCPWIFAEPESWYTECKKL